MASRSFGECEKLLAGLHDELSRHARWLLLTASGRLSLEFPCPLQCQPGATWVQHNYLTLLQNAALSEVVGGNAANSKGTKGGVCNTCHGREHAKAASITGMSRMWQWQLKNSD